MHTSPAEEASSLAYSIKNMLISIFYCEYIGVSRIFVPKTFAVKVDLEGIGYRIRSLRGEMLQEDFAKYLGISQGQLSKIERGKLAPTVEILIRLVKKFGKSADWLLMGQG